tara:strand:- start:1197 stop:1943 length:747 start_codon:yes stop_codon:yes gene_type:complete
MAIIESNTMVWFLCLLPVVAFLYSSVGHGGASGYLALMALFNFAPETMKTTALILNLFVAGISFYHFAKKGYFNMKLFLPFAVASIPAAFVGGMLSIDATWYKIILGLILLFAIFRMVFQINEHHKLTQLQLWQGLFSGALIGFFSGLIGIGGGIILSPLILVFKWGKIKEAAAVSALFIWVNSLSGLMGQLSSGLSFDPMIYYMIGFAVVGGFLGGYFGSSINNKNLKYGLASVLFAASVKLIFIHG